jgi:hypothetical protein
VRTALFSSQNECLPTINHLDMGAKIGYSFFVRRRQPLVSLCSMFAAHWIRMLTDTPPRKKNRESFSISDRTKALELPHDGQLVKLAGLIESAMKDGAIGDVRVACAEFLDTASEFYNVPPCPVRVLAARPLRVREYSTTELFGDYHPSTMLIRVWTRTAVRKEITSFGTFLSTVCHEFCHHLDFHRFGFQDSWHTRGFYERAGALYHHAKSTPAKQLFWRPATGHRWRIDWPRTNRSRIS